MGTSIAIRNLVSGNLNYSEQANAFLSNGFVSAANNTYYSALRFGEGVIIKEEIGEGYKYTFLNGIKIYSINEKVLLAEKSFHCVKYDKSLVYSESKKLLMELVDKAAVGLGFLFNRSEAEKMIGNVLNQSFHGNQLEIAQQQIRKSLSA